MRETPAPAPAPRRATPTTRPGALWLWGRHAVAAALANPRRTCHRLLATAEAQEDLGDLATRSGLALELVEREAIARVLGPDAVHQGVALQAAPLPEARLDRACAPGDASGARVVVLDRVTDPRNLGAILRVAAAFGARAVVVPDRHSAQIGGALAKAAAGALERVPLVAVTNLARALDELKAMGYWVAALDGAADTPLAGAPDFRHLALVLGAEGAGLRRLVGEHCDLSLRIPMAEGVESLNVAVACGIALYALRPSALG